MNPQDQRTIEQLLELIGSEESLADSRHRYALRRSLLNSRYFEVHRAKVVWERFISISGPAFAGGFVVIMVVLAVHIQAGQIENAVEVPSSQFVVVEEEVEELPEAVAVTAALDEPSVLPDIQYFYEEPPVAQFVNFVSSNVEMATMR